MRREVSHDVDQRQCCDGGCVEGRQGCLQAIGIVGLGRLCAL